MTAGWITDSLDAARKVPQPAAVSLNGTPRPVAVDIFHTRVVSGPLLHALETGSRRQLDDTCSFNR